MQFEVKNHGAVTIFKLKEKKLDATVSPELKGEFLILCSEPTKQLVIDMTDAPELAEGDWVELPYHLPNAAQQTAVSQYELLTILGHRFAR